MKKEIVQGIGIGKEKETGITIDPATGAFSSFPINARNPNLSPRYGLRDRSRSRSRSPERSHSHRHRRRSRSASSSSSSGSEDSYDRERRERRKEKKRSRDKESKEERRERKEQKRLEKKEKKVRPASSLPLQKTSLTHLVCHLLIHRNPKSPLQLL
jgi:hypothetical protein